MHCRQPLVQPTVPLDWFEVVGGLQGGRLIATSASGTPQHEECNSIGIYQPVRILPRLDLVDASIDGRPTGKDTQLDSSLSTMRIARYPSCKPRL